MRGLPLSLARTLVPLLALVVLTNLAGAQFTGARGDRESLQRTAAPGLDPRAVENYITVEGKVEKRLDPTALRIVFALMVEQPTASACESECRKREEQFLKALESLKIGRGAVAVDFISILPTYEWQIETREGQSVAVEKKPGFRMQSNVHVQVATEDEARAVLREALRLGISDVIAFDYGHKEIDRYKKEAREEALKVAKEKAHLLLTTLFNDPPRPLNVHESTEVVYPRSLYDAFQNVHTQELDQPFLRDRMARIQLAKPKNTYYRGFLEETDVQGGGLPLRPQISVVSTVRLYYATPATKDKKPAAEGGAPGERR